MKDWWNKKLAIRAFYLFLALSATIMFGVVIINFNKIAGWFGGFFGAITPFVIGFAVAYILNPAYTMIREKVFGRIMPNAKTKVKKALSILALYLIVLGIVGVLLYLVIPQFFRSIADCVNNLIANYDKYYKSVDQFVAGVTGNNDAFGQVVSMASTSLFNWLKSINVSELAAISGVAGSIISSVFDVFIGVIVSIYMLYNKEKFGAQIKKTGYALFSKKTMYRLQRWFGTAHEAFGEYFTGVIIDAMIVGTTFGVLCVIFRVPYAPLIGVVLGLTNMIPFFGPYIGGVPCTVIVLVSDPWKALILVIMMLVVQQIDANFISPRIISHKMGLAAVWIIFAILVGGSYFGVVGMLLAVPVFSVAYVFFSNFIKDRLHEKKMSGDTADYLATADVAQKYECDDTDSN